MSMPYLVDSAPTAHLVQHTRTKIISRLENSYPQLAKLDPPQSVLHSSASKVASSDSPSIGFFARWLAGFWLAIK